jgi:hypothetical protein
MRDVPIPDAIDVIRWTFSASPARSAEIDASLTTWPTRRSASASHPAVVAFASSSKIDGAGELGDDGYLDALPRMAIDHRPRPVNLGHG